MTVVHVRLLGPVDVVVDGVVYPVRGMRRKAVLAVLALHAGEVVSTDLLTEVVWAGSPPATVVNTLQSHVSYLRGIFGDREVIAAMPPGYRLQLGRPATDVAAATEMIARSHELREPSAAASLLRAALTLWRDREMTDLSGLPWFDQKATHLERIRTSAVKALIQARLAMGEHALLLPEIEELAQRLPFDEVVHGQWMLALYRTGQQVEALQAYQALRRFLGEELGIEPSPPLQDLQMAILRHDPSIAAVTSPAALTTSISPESLAPFESAFASR